ncbi:hypothetical protein ABTK06_20170, partial [Acinetobacter baumannii]
LFFAVCAFGAVGVAPLAPDASDLPVKRIKEELPLPKLDEQVAALESTDQQFTREATFKSSEPLSTFLQRIGVDDDEA